MTVEEMFEKIDKKMDNIINEQSNTTMIIENEIRKNIQIIAENHGSLNDKLDKLITEINRYKLKDEISEIELDTIKSKILKLEKEIDELKKAVNKSA